MSYLTSRLQVKYREKYISTLGTWKSIPDRPEFFFNKIVNENVSNVSTVGSQHIPNVGRMTLTYYVNFKLNPLFMSLFRSSTKRTWIG